MSSRAIRFPIRFDDGYRKLSRALFLSPSRSYLEVVGDDVSVQMAWGFRTKFPKSVVKAVSASNEKPLSRGVHGFGGRWLVNGSGDGIVTIDLEPRQRAYVIGFPVKLRQVLVSLEDPEKLMTMLNRSAASTPRSATR